MIKSWRKMTRDFSANHRANNAMKTWALTLTIQTKLTSFSKIAKKGDNLARYTQIFDIFPRKFSFHSTLLPEFLEFSVEWSAFRKFNSFRNFWKRFREFSVPFAAVFKFSNVLFEWKALHMKELINA